MAETYDVLSLLSSPNRDFLVRNINGEQVKINSLKGKKLIGLYFSSSFFKVIDNLVEVYTELSPKGDFEIILVPVFEDVEENLSNDDFSKMPWLSIPYSELETSEPIQYLFSVGRLPYLVFLDENGKVLTDKGDWLVSEYGLEAFPFTPEKLKQFKELEEKAEREQTLKSLLVSPSRDFVITSEGKQVPVSELEGKVVGLYFQSSIIDPYEDFTDNLAEAYNQLKEEGNNFEIVMTAYRMDENDYKNGFAAPWLALPIKDDSCWKLVRYFKPDDFPALVIIGPDGKTLNPNAGKLIEREGAEAYPFGPITEEDY